MRHRVRAGNLGRTGAHRTAMYRNLVTSLFEHERVRTTDEKAKGVRSLAEKMISLGKRGGLHARRRALRVIRRREIAAKVFDDLAERFRNRAGGYTRIVKLAPRPGDGARMSIIELVDSEATRGARAAAGRKAGAKPDAKAAKAAETGSKRAAKKDSAKPKGDAAPAKSAPAKKAAAKSGAKRAAKPQAATAKGAS
ncbi:MAG TPA: 50S ribosomal protein L17, partial [Myxococcota bacterium]|nr:50S ribosomal protein L17 [Myxococcota bacterium]